MNELADINKKVPKGFFFYRQIQHLMFVMIMVPGALYLVSPHLDGTYFLELTDKQWVNLLIATIVLHHIYVWIDSGYRSAMV